MACDPGKQSPIRLPSQNSLACTTAQFELTFQDATINQNDPTTEAGVEFNQLVPESLSDFLHFFAYGIIDHHFGGRNPRLQRGDKMPSPKNDRARSVNAAL